MEKQLDGCDFVRIHNDTIVNVNHIRELRQWPRGALRIFLLDGIAVVNGQRLLDTFSQASSSPNTLIQSTTLAFQ